VNILTLGSFDMKHGNMKHGNNDEHCRCSTPKYDMGI
jgi:hypothetical protein